MIVALPPPNVMSVEEYLRLEETSDVRHEFYHNERHEMPGGTFNHNRIIGNLRRLLEDQSDCWVLTENVRLYLPAHISYFYPDAMLVCSDQNGQAVSATDPLLLAEVLSESSETIDRYIKWEMYQSLPTLQAYILIRQDKPKIELYERQPNNEWRYLTLSNERPAVKLSDSKIEISIEAVYKRVLFEH